MKKQVPLRLEENDYKQLRKILIDMDISFQEFMENFVKEFINYKGDKNEL